jgi:hypothetical protein
MRAPHSENLDPTCGVIHAVVDVMLCIDQKNTPYARELDVLSNRAGFWIFSDEREGSS